MILFTLSCVQVRGVTIHSCHDLIHITILNSRYDIIAILQDI